jgi:hypothetical protein
MSYLTYIALFGAAVTIFLWLRDARIFFKTGFPGYRMAAYHGVIYGAVSTLGVVFTINQLELLGLGLILGALFLQGRIEREKVWGNEGRLERFLGSVPPQKKANKK